jgi:hypothetical protein
VLKVLLKDELTALSRPVKPAGVALLKAVPLNKFGS